jgi:hypothetical protein
MSTAIGFSEPGQPRTMSWYAPRPSTIRSIWPSSSRFARCRRSSPAGARTPGMANQSITPSGRATQPSSETDPEGSSAEL